MKEWILTNSEAHRVDQYAIHTLGIPGTELMKKAGSYVSRKTKKYLKHVPGSQVDIFCGTGNNGGDGFVAAQQLSDWGVTVNIWLAGEPEKIQGDARHYYEQCLDKPISIRNLKGQRELPTVKEIAQSDLIIDALLGTGFRGEVKGIIKELIDIINDSGRPVIAVDIPSGVSGDTGQVGGTAVEATATVTMGFLKRGLFFQPGKRLAGEIFLADLKYPAKAFTTLEYETYLVDKKIISHILPPIPDDTYKHRQGKVLLFAGSPGMTGAACLAAQAALRSGAGLVISAIPKSLNLVMEIKNTETLSLPLPETVSGTFSRAALAAAAERIEWSDVVVFGPGVSTNEETLEFGRDLLQSVDKPIVVDADGLRVFQNHLGLIKTIKDLILTPHLGEFAMITGQAVSDLKTNIIDAGRQFVLNYPCTLVLKGAPTVVVSREGHVAVNSTGNPALATGGTGDILTGLIAGLRAQKMNAFDAAVAAVFVHGLAADYGCEKLGVRGLIAGDLLSYIPGVLQEFEKVV